MQDAKVGDNITHQKNPAKEPIPGYKEVKPMVFSGIFPTYSDDFEDLRSALEKLQLNDASLSYQPETSKALGDRKSTRLHSSHVAISYAVFCLRINTLSSQ